MPLAGLNPDAVAYNCCIQDCNELNTTNINDEPGFAYTTEPNNLPVVGNYHLAWNSPCVDTGDSDEYTDELDMDGEPRIDGTSVDRGADEACSCDQDLTEDDIFNLQDWNADGLVNLEEFSVFSSAWLTEDTNIYFNPLCDLDTDDDIDLADLVIFSDPDNWLWQACWKQNLYEMYSTYSMMSGGENMLVLSGTEGMMQSMSMDRSLITSPTLGVVTHPVDKTTIVEQLLTLNECVEFLDKIWLEEPDIRQEISEDDWKKFMDSIYDSAVELKTQLDHSK